MSSTKNQKMNRTRQASNRDISDIVDQNVEFEEPVELVKSKIDYQYTVKEVITSKKNSRKKYKVKSKDITESSKEGSRKVLN